MLWIKSVAPRLVGEWRISNDIVEGLERAVFGKKRIGKTALAFFNFGGRFPMKPHVERGKCGSSVVQLLAVDSDTFWRFGPNFEEERAAATSRVIHGIGLAFGIFCTNHFCHDARHFGRSVKLSLAFT